MKPNENFCTVFSSEKDYQGTDYCLPDLMIIGENRLPAGVLVRLRLLEGAVYFTQKTPDLWQITFKAGDYMRHSFVTNSAFVNDAGEPVVKLQYRGRLSSAILFFFFFLQSQN